MTMVHYKSVLFTVLCVTITDLQTVGLWMWFHAAPVKARVVLQLGWAAEHLSLCLCVWGKPLLLQSFCLLLIGSNAAALIV